MRPAINLLIMLAMLQPLSVSGADSPAEIVSSYIAAVLDQRWEEAAGYWHPAAVKASKRLGINYTNVPLKFDCSSPLLYYDVAADDGLPVVRIDTIIVPDRHARIAVSIQFSSLTATHQYHACQNEETWFLHSPILFLTNDWSTIDTDYTRIHFTDSTRLNSHACGALDAFIESTGKNLGINHDRLQYLRQVKIPYYLCSEEQFQMLTGLTAHGITDLPTDAVITRHLPHKHELVHILVNYAAADIGLFASSFIQEGTAVYFGGRWGRSADAIRYLGAAIGRMELAGVEDLLTNHGFHRTIGSPDISYPLSALLVECLIDQSGTDFIKLYRQLSGTVGEIDSWDVKEIIGRIEETVDISWDEVIERYRWLALNVTDCGVKPYAGSPDGERIASFYSDDSTIRVDITDLREEFCFEIHGNGKEFGGILLFSSEEIHPDDIYKSHLFAEHCPRQPYSGEYFGIRFSPDEIGCYDYLCNELTGTYVPSFSSTAASHADIHYDTVQHIYHFTVAKSLFPDENLSCATMRVVGR